MNEENVSAKRIGAKAETWLPRSHGLRSGPPGIVKEEGEGAKTPFCLEWAVSIRRLRKRQDFVRIGKTGRRAGSRFFSLQVAAISPQLRSTSAIRVGFTATKKVGNAVERNRARRRMRVLADSVLSEYVMPDGDCVLLARRPLLDAKYDQLARELKDVLRKLRIEIRNTGIRQ